MNEFSAKLVVVVAVVIVWCGNIQDVRGQNQDPVGFTVIEESKLQNTPKSRDGLPVQVDITFDVLGKSVNLKLDRNEKINNPRFYKIKKSNTGIPVIVHEEIPKDSTFGEYQDPSNTASFTLTCDDVVEGTDKSCNPRMEGSFVTDNEEYQLRAMDDKSLHRRRREANNLWKMALDITSSADGSRKVYGIYRTKPSVGTKKGFTEPFHENHQPRPTALAKTAENKIVRENIVPGKQPYNIEVLAVIDYPVYERFFKTSKGKTTTDRATETKSRIIKYFSHVFNGIDLLYRAIDDSSLGISVGVKGFVIADSFEMSDFTTSLREPVTNGRDQIRAKSALESFINWSFRARNLPERDHIMLFTGYDIYSFRGSRRDNNTAGYARVGAMCDVDSSSIIEEQAGYQSINTATHELGHSLGARHDGSGNPCSQYDQYIMTANGGFENEANKANPWKFSPCSLTYFRNFLNRLPNDHCMSDPLDVFDLDRFIELVSVYPGQEMGPNQQCQEILGLDSYYGWGINLGAFSDVCTDMACSIPGAGNRFRIVKAVTGTSCGDKRWCMQGRCVFSVQAPAKPDKCVHGDSLQLFGGRSCTEHILEFPGRCYQNYFSTRCCNICSRLHTGTESCKYGDRYRGCNSQFCDIVPGYRNNCCSTCGIAPHPVAKPTTTPRPTTRMVFTRRTTTTILPTTTKQRTTPTTATTTVATATNNGWWSPATTTRQWRPVTRRATTPRPETVRTTRRPATVRTTQRSTTRRPSVLPTPDGPCFQLKKEGTFLRVFRCSSLENVFGSNACQNLLIRSQCCELCPSGNPSNTQCVDAIGCTVSSAHECYTKSVRDQCCQTCAEFDTNVPGCEYGDRLTSCSRLIQGLGLTYVCNAYSHYCCQSCDTSAATVGGVNTIETTNMKTIKPSETPKASGSVNNNTTTALPSTAIFWISRNRSPNTIWIRRNNNAVWIRRVPLGGMSSSNNRNSNQSSRGLRINNNRNSGRARSRSRLQVLKPVRSNWLSLE